ncbi:hypothetical protein ACLMJK_004505 [Lecanora helva]
MATEVPSSEPGQQMDQSLDEVSIAASLTRLQEMHVALRNLRETIPRIMDSVLLDPPEPEQLHTQFAQAARTAALDIKSFAQIMEDPHTKEVLEKAKESKAKNAEDITNWLVTEHEDWLNVTDVGVAKLTNQSEQRAGLSSSSSELKAEDLQSALESFKESHPGVEISKEEDSKMIKMYLPSPAHIHFEIDLASMEKLYHVNTKEQTKLHRAIVESVTARTHADDLESLLTSNPDPVPDALAFWTVTPNSQSEG